MWGQIMLKFSIRFSCFLILFISLIVKADVWPSDFLFTGQDFIYASQEQRTKLMDAIGNLFKEMEKKDKLQVQLGKGSFEICTNAGWIDSTTKKKSSCSFNQFEVQCESGKIKCAAWTGVDRCVEKKSTSRISDCLKNRSQNELDLSRDHYVSENSHIFWNTEWLTISLYCRHWIDSRSCEQVKRIASQIIENKKTYPKTSFLRENKTGISNAFNYAKIKILLYLSLFDSDKAYALSCKYDEANKVFEKKDGSKIKLSFATHSANNLQSSTMGKLLGATSLIKTNPQAVHEAMDSILEKNSNTISGIKNQRSELKKHNYQWMGLEADSQEMNSIIQNLKEKDIVEIILEVENYPPNKIDDYKLLALGPAAYTMLNDHNNSLLSIPMEDVAAKKNAENIMQVNLKFVGMISGMKIRGIISEADVNILMNAMENAVTKAELVSSRTDVKNVLGKLNQGDKVLVNEFIESLDSFAKSSHLREYHVALNAFKQKGDGIIFMGSAHEKGVAKFLTDLCNGINIKPEMPKLTMFAQEFLKMGRPSPPQGRLGRDGPKGHIPSGMIEEIPLIEEEGPRPRPQMK